MWTNSKAQTNQQSSYLDVYGCCHLVLRVDGHLEDELAEGHLAHVKPLAVDVRVVDVLASGRDPLKINFKLNHLRKESFLRES